MKNGVPLYVRILLLFGVNVALILAALVVVFRQQYGKAGDWLLAGPAGERVEAMARPLDRELLRQDPLAWDGLLQKAGDSQGIRLSLYSNSGRRLAGPDLDLPEKILKDLEGLEPRRGPPSDRPGELRAPPEFSRQQEGGPPGLPSRAEPDTQLIYRKHLFSDPEKKRHLLVVRLPPPPPEARELFRGPRSLIAELPSLAAGGLVLDRKPWMVTACVLLVLSVALWFPMVKGISHALRNTATVTGRIAEGDFAARVVEDRGDEIGRLAASVNRMAERLEGYVQGQKRFLGDVAHELCAPIARIQLSIGILEQRAENSQSAHLSELRDEVQHMSGLVNELLSFTKAGLRPRDVQLRPVRLLECVQQVVKREGAGEVVRIQIDPSHVVLAEPDLLSRALANLVRNALKYAGTAGPIDVSSRTEGENMFLSVADHGPGVPGPAVEKLFDPFYRVDPSRDRETGGVGLGLAIVKTCVESCQGTVSAHNRPAGGLEVMLALLPA